MIRYLPIHLFFKLYLHVGRYIISIMYVMTNIVFKYRYLSIIHVTFKNISYKNDAHKLAVVLPKCIGVLDTQNGWFLA